MAKHPEMITEPRKPLVYIAGPYTNPDPVDNTRRAIIWTDKKERIINAVPTKEKIMTKRDTVHIYEHNTGTKLKGTWDWHRIDAYNGNIVATSHNQGYTSADEAERMARKINRKARFVRDD